MIASDVRAALSQMAAWPLFAWLYPSLPVVLTMPDGSLALPTAQGLKPADLANSPRHFCGAVVPEDLVLFKPLPLPPMSQAEQAAAIELAAQTASPFSPGDAVWAYRNGHLALASRRQLSQHVAEMASDMARPSGNEAALFELWLVWPDGHLELLRGFGEARRLAHQTRWLLGNVVLVLASVVLSAGLLLTPALELRGRLELATNEYTQLAARAVPAVKDRESLLQATDLLSAAAQRVQQPVPVLAALDRLTAAVPDDTFLQTLQLVTAPGLPVKVTMAGLTSNAPSLMKQLGGQVGFVGVKAPTAAIRPLGATREAFTVELTIEPQPQPQPQPQPVGQQP